jgi:hypothetical protein
VIAFGGHAPSLVFYTRTPALHTDDLHVVQDLFAAAGPVFLVTSAQHFAEIERALGTQAHVWDTTSRRRLYGNRPPPGS